MVDRTLARGLCLAAIALVFGLSSLHYSMGALNRPGPGLFPAIVSAALLAVALISLVRSRFVEPRALEIRFKGAALVATGLGTFAALSAYINMTLGIIAMVFIVSRASTSFSWLRCSANAAGLIAIAFAFKKLFGLNLPLY